MKKKVLFLVVLIIIGTTASAQVLDLVTTKTWGNIGKNYKSQTDGYYVDICPFGPSDGSSSLGFYGGNLYGQFAQEGITNGRITSWFGGFSVNALTDNNLFFKIHAGFKQSTVRYEKFNCDFNDYQENFDFDFLGKFGFYKPEAEFLNRTIFTFAGNQPITTKKRLYYDDNFVSLNDSLASNLQFLSVNLDQTIYKFGLDKNNNWLLNFDLNLGYVLEHPILKLNESSSYFTVGGGISIFGGDYFNQNMCELRIFNKIGSFQPGWQIEVKFNLVPLVFFFMGENCE